MVDIEKYKLMEFDEFQIQQISLGLENGVDVSLYADPKFDLEQMGEIRLGLRKGIDVSVYANASFSNWQMNFMRYALLQGFDVSELLNNNLSYIEMVDIMDKQRPSVEQIMKNFKIVNDGKKAIFYKAVDKLNDTTFCSGHNEKFIYEIGKVTSEPNVDRNVNRKCSYGILVSSLAWAKEIASCWVNPSFVEVEVDIDDIVLSISIGGNVRASHVKVLREIF